MSEKFNEVPKCFSMETEEFSPRSTHAPGKPQSKTAPSFIKSGQISISVLCCRYLHWPRMAQKEFTQHTHTFVS